MAPPRALTRTLLVALIASAAPAVAVGTAPAAAQVSDAVTLYENGNYGGKQLAVTQHIPDLRAHDFGDTTSSAVNLRGATAALYEHEDFRGICEELWDRRPSFRGGLLGNDSVSSILVDEECDGQAILYEDANYGGSENVDCEGFGCLLTVNSTSTPHVVVRGGEPVFDLNVVAHAEDFGDRTSSVLLPYGGMVSLYSDSGYQGRCQEVFGYIDYIDDLAGSTVGNDAVSSVSNGVGCTPSLNLFTGPRYTGGVLRLEEAQPQHDLPQLDFVPRSFTNALRNTQVSVYSGPAFTGECTPIWTGEKNRGRSFASLRWGASCPSIIPAPTLYLYPDIDYSGPAATITATTSDLRPAGLDDVASAVVNASDRTVSVYTEIDARSGCLELAPRASIADLSKTTIGNDSISSVVFGRCPPPPQGTRDSFGQRFYDSYTTDQRLVQDLIGVSNFSNNVISLYREKDFAGVCQNVPPKTRIDDLTGSVVGYKETSSLRITAPCPEAVQLFADKGYQGAVRTLTTSTSDLAATNLTTSSLVNNTTRVVSVYSQVGYRARCQNVSPGTAISDLAGSAVGDNTIQSVRIGQPCRRRVLLFDRAEFAGAFIGVATDQPDLSTLSFGRRAGAVVNNTGGTVSLYSARNYTGRCQNVLNNAAVPNLAGSVVHDNAVLSVRFAPCPAGVTLFRDVGFSGGTVNLTALQNELSGSTWDDAAESLVNNTEFPFALYSNPGFLGFCELLVPGQAVSARPPTLTSLRVGTCDP